MNILVFDTETTGFPRSNADLSVQPHIVQLACVLHDMKRDVEVASLNLILRAPIESVPTAASDVHGITLEHINDFGVSPRSALATFTQLVRVADLVVAHNINFDLQLIDILCQRESAPNIIASKDKFCTMEHTINLCKLPSQRGGYKWPKLSEAYKHLFAEDLVGAHDALVDVRACLRIYKHLAAK